MNTWAGLSKSIQPWSSFDKFIGNLSEYEIDVRDPNLGTGENLRNHCISSISIKVVDKYLQVHGTQS